MFAVFEVLEENEHNNGLLNFFFCPWSLGRGFAKAYLFVMWLYN